MEEHLDAIRREFKEELDERKKLLDKIYKLEVKISALTRTLITIRSSCPMTNDLCTKCVWKDECVSEGRVEGKSQICSSFRPE